jgi:hypothetical protein
MDEQKTRETLVRAVADDSGFRSRHELRELVAEVRALWKKHDDEFAKALWYDGDDESWLRSELAKVAAMREDANVAGKEILAAERLRERLLGPLTEDECFEAERLRVEKVRDSVSGDK